MVNRSCEIAPCRRDKKFYKHRSQATQYRSKCGEVEIVKCNAFNAQIKLKEDAKVVNN